MSWSIGPIRVFHDTAEGDLADAQPQGQDAALPHVAEAVTAAKAAAVAIVRSGVVGWGHANVSLAGHANEGHRPAPPWANDTLSVSVYQVE